MPLTLREMVWRVPRQRVDTEPEYWSKDVARHRTTPARSRAAGTTLTLEMRDGTKVVVARPLAVISTYVLLEQERWFEKEIDFVAAYLKSGRRSELGIGSHSAARVRKSVA